MLKSLLLVWTLGLPALQLAVLIATPNGFGPLASFFFTGAALVPWTEGLVVIGVLLYVVKPHRNV